MNGHDFPSSPQAYFLTLGEEEAMYGGAAGGGKSVALLAAALQYVTEPKYSAILFRRTFADLNQADCLIPMSHEWLGRTDAKWVNENHQWVFPSGAILSFGYLESTNDHLRYKGAPFQFIGFDELTDINPIHYTFMQTRRRRLNNSNVPLRTRSATNPGGRYHEYYKQRFLIESNWDRVFVPAKMTDNPGLDHISYRRSLAQADPVTRAQMEHGDWDITPQGNMFKREWFDGRIVKEPPSQLYRTVRAWDMAATEPSASNPDPDYAAGAKGSLMMNGKYIIQDMSRMRGNADAVQRRMGNVAEADTKNVTIGVEQEPGSAGKIVVDNLSRTILRGYAVFPIKPTGDKIVRARPLSAACSRGDVYLQEGPWISKFMDEAVSFGEDCAHDDQIDAASHMFNMLPTRIIEKSVNRVYI